MVDVLVLEVLLVMVLLVDPVDLVQVLVDLILRVE